MEPNRVEFQKQCIFQSFCKRVLHNEACNAHDEIRRHRAKEVTFSDLALHEERQLYTLDKYFQGEEAEPGYQQAGKKITPKLLLDAIRTLPEEKRKAILLYYFEGMAYWSPILELPAVPTPPWISAASSVIISP